MKSNTILKQIFITIGSIAIIAYVALQINLSFGDSIEIVNSTYGQAKKSIQLDAFIFRDETPIISSSRGVASFFFDDGEKVAKGSELMKIYSDPNDTRIQEQINEYNNKIALLEKSSAISAYAVSDLDSLEDSIREKIELIMESVNQNKLDMANLTRNDLLMLMDRRSSAITSKGGYKIIIDEYTAKAEELKNQIKGNGISISSDVSGYFYSSCDGMENTFSMSALEMLSLDDYDKLKNAAADEVIAINSFGKIVNDSEWYLVIKMNKADYAKYSEENGSPDSFDIRFPYSDGITLSMKKEKLVSRAKSDDVLLVLSTSMMPQNFNFMREQPVEFVIAEYEGIKVPTPSIRVINGETGVYILDGNIVRFKKTTVLYEESGYCYCSFPDKKDLDKISKDYLSLFDPVIVAGKELYEGKLIK